MAKRLAFVNKNRCAACGACTDACPRGAIAVHKGCYAAVIAEKCVGCALCAKACPVGCVEIKEREQNED